MRFKGKDLAYFGRVDHFSCQRNNQSMIQTGNMHDVNPNLRNRKVILAVGCENKRLHFYSTLAGAGASIIEASNGLEVLSKFDKYKANLIIIDEGLPVINGKNVAGIIENCDVSSYCSVLLVSSGSDFMDVSSEETR